MSKASTAPRWDQRTVDGVVYLSLGAMADALNRHPRTVTKLERRGVIVRGRTLPGIGVDGARWYTQAEISTYRRLATETGFRTSKFRTTEFIEAVAAERQHQDEALANGEPLETDPPLVRVWHRLTGSGAEEKSTVTTWSSLGGESPASAPTVVRRCDRCKSELLWIMRPVPGGQALAEVPWCEHCHRVMGEPDCVPVAAAEPRCPRCGAETVTDFQDNPDGPGMIQVSWCLRCDRAVAQAVRINGMASAPAPSEDRETCWCGRRTSKLGLTDQRGDYIVQVTCELHGPLQEVSRRPGPRPDEAERVSAGTWGDGYEIATSTAEPSRRERPRGLTESNNPWAVQRVAKPPSGPKIEIMLPVEGGTRPSR